MVIKNTYIRSIAIILLFISSSSLPNKSVVTLFSHGIADLWKQARLYLKTYKSKGVIHRNLHYTINSPYVSFNYPDATTRFYRVNYNETSFGQENEIRRLYTAYGKTLKRFAGFDVILYGLSRGASNVLIFAGLYDLPEVKALILESPYFTMTDVIENMLRVRNLSWVPLSYGEMLAEMIFKKYTRHGNSPANCLEFIPHDMPILIICSKEDTLVPYTSSMEVYKKLIQTGHKNTYIFVTDHGKHAEIIKGTNGQHYQWVVNAFYKKFNLSYVASDAEKGESILSLCQP